MADVLSIFNKPTVLDYLGARQYQSYAIGESLFPEQKYDTLDFEYLVGADELPVVAKVHAFDTEAEIGSLASAKQAIEAAYIKKKYQITEKDLVALSNPRTAQEQTYVMQRVFNVLDKAVNDVRSRVELMRMQAVSTGQLTLEVYNGTTTSGTIVVDYGVPASQKETLAGGDKWDVATADILGDLQRWQQALPVPATRALASRKVVGAILANSTMNGYLYGAGSGRVGNIQDLNQFLMQQGLPTIVIYDVNANSRYRTQLANGTYTVASYFPEDKFVMLPDGPLGQTLYGPTPDENKMIRDNVITQYTGNVIGYFYEEGQDPIGTWAKAAATAIPSFPQAGNVFLATVL